MSFVLVLIFGCLFSCACAGDEEGTPTPVPSSLPDSAIELAIQGAEEARDELDALRCYLLHQGEVREGRAPEGWEQPPLEFYERVSRHPCSILPGFSDPLRAERERLEKQKAQQRVQEAAEKAKAEERKP